MSAPALAALWLCALCRAQDGPADSRAVIREDVSIRAGKGSGPALVLPQAGPDRAVVDEVVGSLKVMNTDHRARVANVRVAAAAKLAQPFPESPFLVFSPRLVTAPYDLWTFEVLADAGETVARQDGTGRVVEPIEWDGGGASGDDVVRTGRSYWFRFTGRRGAESFVLVSEPARLASLGLREFLGGVRLEVASSELFEESSAKLSAGAERYLSALVERMRRVAPKDGYSLELRQRKPEGALALKRAETLRRRLADRLLVNAGRVRVQTLEPGSRGETLACLLPAEKGETIRVE